jgi:hypothetical protein
MNNFNDLKNKLTENDIEQLLDLVGYRCQAKTINRMRSVLTYSASSISYYGILNRLYKSKTQWEYCAGQSYPDEIRTIRAIFKTGH